MGTKPCVVCGEALPVVHRSHRRYCQARCRMRAMRIRDRGVRPERRERLTSIQPATPLPPTRAPAPQHEPKLTPPEPKDGVLTSHERDRPTPQQFDAYQALYDYFNRTLFDGTLPSVLLTFSHRGNTPGFFMARKWEDGQGCTHEIGINPHLMHERPLTEIAASFVHDMCHLWQHVYGHKVREGYHSRQWAMKMQEIGLIPSDTGKSGGRSIGDRMKQYVDAEGPFAQVVQSLPADRWLPWQRIPPHSSGTSRNLVKYSCPNRHGNAWGKPNLWLICGHCRADYLAA